MDITPLIASDRQVIQSYSPGAFRISGQLHAGAVIVFPERTFAWTAQSASLTVADFSPLLESSDGLDILIFGGGPRAVLPDPDIRAAFRARKIGFEIMDTGAACRTYNVLMADGRRIAAALLPL